MESPTHGHIVQLVQFLGYIVNATNVEGKAFIFRIRTAKNYFECVLFVHPTAESFVTLPEDITNEDKNDIKQAILKNYKYEDLLQYEESEK